MKILMLTPYVPYPPSSGGQVRTYNLLKYLSKNHKIHLVCLYKNHNEKKYEKFISLNCEKIYFCKRSEKPFTLKNIFKSIFSMKPFLVIRNHSEEAEKILREILTKEKFDIIHSETFYIMPHIPKTDIPIFLVEQTIEYRVYEHFIKNLPFFLRIFLFLDILKLKKTEIDYWKKAKKVGTVSKEDAKIIKKHIPFINPEIIPNGAGEDLIEKDIKFKTQKKHIILFVGNFSWLQNIEAAEYLIKKIYPLAEKIKNILFVIAGQNADKKLKKITAKKLKIVNLNPDDNLKIKKLYQSASIFIAPIFGPGGTRLKILGAMASGLPVISTKTGVMGLDVEDNKSVLIAETPEEFIKQIKRIINNKNLYKKIKNNARKLILEKYNWKAISKKLEKIYYNIKYENRN